ncbi:MAG: hypothetical protein N3E45_08695 [Oscillatoriaceae bacterium SKW80]|nr:hypothetical protein [Oscillatoriaceae bacterium SKYG93]MCX8120897.1 hypothetical protein [Oscillatoriaceae bacterium SKW80]MDW8452170.1 hypothetical protein [Oscillatoriaceae cyanobacterium SKYGB_i_bin93]
MAHTFIVIHELRRNCQEQAHCQQELLVEIPRMIVPLMPAVVR